MRSLALLASLVVVGCSSDAPSPPPSDAGSDAPVAQPQPLGGPCSADEDCLAGVCLTSSYGTPFCTRPCEATAEACPAGPDAAAGASLCVGFDDLPNPNAPAFVGELRAFCVPRCTDLAACDAVNPDWEACDVPRWLGDQLYPNIGAIKVCAAPSFQGKDPVDPALCDWEKTIRPNDPDDANRANLCRSYCGYLDACKIRPDGSRDACCEWGCFNRMEVEGKLNAAWRDEVTCFVQHHKSYAGTQKVCVQEPIDCGKQPEDPTPAAAAGP